MRTYSIVLVMRQGSEHTVLYW